jgi:hypothetical protein
MASRSLDDLDPRFRPIVVEFLARAIEAKIPLLVVETRRTLAEHEANVKAGKSWTPHSKHIRGMAIDVVPYHYYGPGRADKRLLWDVKDAAISDPIWEKLGEIGEACGMKWGGRWTQRDCPHFEMADIPVDLDHAANVQTGGRI